jgi:hypothetical protein
VRCFGERSQDRQHQEITLLIGGTFLSKVCDMLQSGLEAKVRCRHVG